MSPLAIQPLDAITLKHLAVELKTLLVGSKVNKIQQANHHEVILHLWQSKPSSTQYKFIISIRPQVSFCGIVPDKIQVEREYPKTPLNFCVLLRKYLIGAKLNTCKVLPDERVLILGFDNYNDTGDIARYELIIEIMGKHSNIILLESDLNLILGSAHGVSEEMSRYRTLRVGDPYSPPPKQPDKQPFSSIVSQDITSLLSTAPKEDWVTLLLNHYSGWGRKTIEELVTKSSSPNALFESIKLIQHTISPRFLNADDVLKGYEIITSNENQSSNTVLTTYYLAVLQHLQYLDIQTPLLRELQTTQQNILKRITHLMDASDIDFESLKAEADSTLTEGAIEHDAAQIQLAQKNYQQYKKAKSRHLQTHSEIEKLGDMLDGLEDIILACEMTTSVDELITYRNLANENGFLKRSKARAETAKNKKPAKSGKKKPAVVKLQKAKPLCLDVSENVRIWIGRTGPENAYLVRHLSQDNDWWFHVPHQPGAHVLLQCDENNPNFDDYMTLAAQCAIYYSRARNEGTSAVIMTQGKNVMSIPGSMAGHVRFKNETQRFIKLDETKIESLILT